VTTRARVVTPLASWFADDRARRRARRNLGRAPILFPARDRTWRDVAPGYAELVRLPRVGLPFQIASERRYDRSGRAARLAPALRDGKTIFFPQIHQVLPRVMRLMVALRVELLGPRRDETSFLFLVDGRGREGLGLHHDDEVHSFWLQLDGRRTVTLGPPVPRGTPQELPDRDARSPGFSTRVLPPGSLLSLPPRTPHRVVCYERSVALSLTWSVAPARRAGAAAAWDVVSGRVAAPPPSSRTRVWTQVPAIAERAALILPDGERARVRHVTRAVAAGLASMASFTRDALGKAGPDLEAHGIVGAQDLPQVVLPDDPRALDGWRFA
jgi:hypothetical protein